MHTIFPINLLNKKFFQKNSEEVILGEQVDKKQNEKKTLDNLEPQAEHEDFSLNLLNFLTQKNESALTEEKQTRAKKLGL
jgi:hypothetical protein